MLLCVTDLLPERKMLRDRSQHYQFHKSPDMRFEVANHKPYMVMRTRAESDFHGQKMVDNTVSDGQARWHQAQSLTSSRNQLCLQRVTAY